VIGIWRWQELERWDAFTIPHLHIAPHLPQKAIGELLTPRHARVNRAEWGFEQLQPITIHFGGEISRRKVPPGTDYSLDLFWVKPGDVVLSKIDLKNGAVGVLPEGWDNAVVTSHFKVYTPDLEQLDPRYFRLLLQTQDFKQWLWANRSGADGRTEVKLDVFEALHIPLPPVARQKALCDDYAAAQACAEQLEQEAHAIERAGWQAFETALGIAPPAPLPDKPVFIARFKGVERWSHEELLHNTHGRDASATVSLEPLENALLEVRHGCSKGPSRKATSLRVLKISAVTRGHLDTSKHKYITDEPALRTQFSLKAGDILMCRTNGTLAYVGMSALVEKDIADTIFPDKVIRVRPDTSRIDAHFLWRLLQLPALRTQIEAAARTAVGNFAIGGKDIKSLKAPLPLLAEQKYLVELLNAELAAATTKRAKAAALRLSARTAFEAALFTASGENSPHQ